MENKKNIVLVNPSWIIGNRKNIWYNVASVMPPLGIAWIASTLEREGHNVAIIDAQAERLSADEISTRIDSITQDSGKINLLGITATTPLIANALKIAKITKRRSPQTRVVLGGAHPTVCPEEALRNDFVDLVVRGEGEITCKEIASGRPLDKIKGISYKKNDTFVHNPDRDLISNLDQLPFPAYHLLPMDRYRPAAGAAKRLPATSILATRGCPGRCTFCYRIFGNKLRWRSGEMVAREVRLLQQEYGIREICFYDDTFTAARRTVKDFCHAINDYQLDLTWSCFSRIDTFDEETFKLMKKSGCHQVLYGIETANPRILKNINKNVKADQKFGQKFGQDHDLQRHRQIIKKTKAIGLEVRAAFMLGNPGETEETMKQNIDYAIELDPDLATFNITTPFPGTEMFNWADRKKILRTKDWSEYDLSRPVMDLPTVSSSKIIEYYKKANRRFYIRPRYILKRLKKLTNINEVVTMMRGLRAVLGL